MTRTEIATLKTISHNLRVSTKTAWETGDMNKWVEWAKLMRAASRSSADLIDALIEGAEADSTPPPNSDYKPGENTPLTLD